jgi:archaellum component FlaF (FlaF/FlaG flagellin family)
MTTNSHETDEDRRRKRLIKFVVVLALAVPLVIEGLTFGGLLSNAFLGGGGSDGPAAQNETTVSDQGVGVGDELLAETTQRERITTATVREAGDSWRFTVTVAVNNTGNRTYQLQLASVETTGGKTVSNVVSTTVEPGNETTVTGQWALPAGERPQSVEVVAVDGVGGNASVTRETVELAPIPVQGR